MYQDVAHKQRVYRIRKWLETLEPSTRLHEEARLVHQRLRMHAMVREPAAVEIVGEDYVETALKLLVRLDMASLKYVEDVALDPPVSRAVPVVKS
jgi:hypothetical protein